MYTEEELIEELKDVITSNDFNCVAKKCRNELKWESLENGTKELYVATLNRIHPCPQEYKDNPHIHYEIPHFCSPNKFNK